MENEMLKNDSTVKEQANDNNWELSGEDSSGKKTTIAEKNESENDTNKEDAAGKNAKSKNSAAKAVSHAQSVIGNTNPNVRTGLSDDLNNTGTNVTYTEREA